MRAQRRCAPSALLLLSGLTLSSQARADHRAEDKATAQVLFDQGRAAVKQGNFSEACPKFAESQRLDPGIGTLLWLGDCYENVGQTATAWATFKEAAAAAKLQHDNREQVARDRINKLEPTLPHVTILVREETAIPKLEILRDGVPVGTAQWGIAVPVDPGTHTIVARAPGRQDWSQTIQVASQKDSVDISVPELEAAPSSAGSPTETSGSSEPNEKGSSFRWSSQYTLAIVTGAVGVLGVGLGTYFSFAAKSAYDSSNSGTPPHCLDNRCDSTGLHDRNDAFDKAALSTALFVASAATLAGGALLYFTAPSPHTTVTVAPSPSAAIARFTMDW